ALARHQVPGRRRRRVRHAVPAPLRPDHRAEYGPASVSQRSLPHGRGPANDGRDRRLPGRRRRRAAEPPRRPVHGGGAGPAAGRREGQRETVQAKALLEKAGRLSDAVQPEDRPELERLMEKVRTALTDRHWPALTAAANELADVLFYLEDA